MEIGWPGARFFLRMRPAFSRVWGHVWQVVSCRSGVPHSPFGRYNERGTVTVRTEKTCSMTDDKDFERQRHWRELAEQLGLEPVAETQDVAHVEPAETDAHDPREQSREESSLGSTGLDDESSEWGSESVELEVVEAEAVELEASEPRVAPEQPEERGGRGGRRGRSRRGGRGGRRRNERTENGRQAEEEDAAAPDAEDAPADLGDQDRPPEEKREGRRRRGAGRNRRDEREPEAEELHEVDEREPAAEAAEPDDDPAEEIDTLSDWNVPSWNELIASLYRPDR